MSSATRTCDLGGGPLDGLTVPWEWPTVNRAGRRYYVIGTCSGLAVYRVYAEAFDAGTEGLGYVPIGAVWEEYRPLPAPLTARLSDSEAPE